MTKMMKISKMINEVRLVVDDNFELSEVEILLIKKVLELEGLAATERPTPGGTKPLLHAADWKEACCLWSIDEWTDNGCYAPELAQLRDVAFLFKMMIADPANLRESVSAPKEGGGLGESWLEQPVVYPSSMQPVWALTSGVRLCVRLGVLEGCWQEGWLGWEGWPVWLVWLLARALGALLGAEALAAEPAGPAAALVRGTPRRGEAAPGVGGDAQLWRLLL